MTILNRNFETVLSVKVTELNTQMKSLRNSLDAAKQELSEYKEKATRILQVLDIISLN